MSVPCKPRQIEFARLGINYTVMSKRKLRRLVEEGYVSGNTTADELNAATAAVRRAGGNLCGVVLNGLNMKSVKYASKYKYGDKYGYRYSYSESYGAK